jgi:hypothetical protein
MTILRPPARRCRRSIVAAFAAALALVPMAAAAQQRPAAAAPAATDAAYEAARTAFEALAEPERQAVQEALVWTGDYNGGADGAFGRRT